MSKEVHQNLVNEEYFRKKPMPWLKSFLQERGIQTSSDGKNKRKAELVELSFKAYKMKLPKIEGNLQEDKGFLVNKLVTTSDGILPKPDSVTMGWSNNFSKVPEVTFPDMCTYLIGKSDEYDQEKLKSFKSLQGYKLFKDGHVLDMKIFHVPNKNYSYVKFKAKPTERSKTGDGKESYDGFVILKSNGSIHGGFCPCLGGADGSCRHVAACLFDIQATVQKNLQQSSTSKECEWKRHGRPNENACAIEELKIFKREFGKREGDTIKPTNFDPRSVHHDPGIFLDRLKEGLEETETSAVILQVLPHTEPVMVNEEELNRHISTQFDHEEEVTAVQVNTIFEMRDSFLASKGLNSLSPDQITEELCQEFCNHISITQDQAFMIFDKTTQQSDSGFWMQQRQGRLTGSNFYRICHLKEKTNKSNILKDLLGYCPLPFEKQPIQFEWGHEKENSAATLYIKKMRRKHQHLFLTESGLVINPEWPYIGASPDRMRYCKCCGKVVVEIKSLYAKRSLMPHVAASDFLYKEKETYFLKKETRWYYQIQGEMAVTKLEKADLVVYTNKGIMIVHVPFDAGYWQSILVKLQNFYSKFMVPEILTQEIKKSLN